MIKLTDMLITGNPKRWKDVEEYMKAVTFKLMLYEDTGLNPDDIKMLRELLKWIPTKESCPMTPGFVLAYVKTADDGHVHFRDTFAIAEYDFESGWVIDGHPEATNIRITHWKPLTAPVDRGE